jgi:hypothetical protein
LCARVSLDAPYHFLPVNLGQFQIEQNHFWVAVDVPPRIHAGPKKEFERFGSIAHHLNTIDNVILF